MKDTPPENPKPPSMREAMPEVTAFIDACREVFGTEVVNDSIRRGMRGEPYFYAEENNIEVGTKFP
jgi:hypothetical protein